MCFRYVPIRFGISFAARAEGTRGVCLVRLLLHDRRLTTASDSAPVYSDYTTTKEKEHCPEYSDQARTWPARRTASENKWPSTTPALDATQPAAPFWNESLACFPLPG